MWQSIALVSIGMVLGMILMNWIDVDVVYKGGKFRIKQKGSDNVLSTDIKSEITHETKRQGRISKRKERRLKRKS